MQNLRLTKEERAGPLGKLAAAFEYAESFPGEETGGVGTFFKPMMELDGRRYPPELHEVTDEVASLWQVASDRIAAPLPRARLNDLCFEGGWGNRGERVRAAASSYLDAADALRSYSGDELDVPVAAFAQLRSMARALALARTIADEELAQRARAAIVVAAEQSLDQAAPAPGVMLGLIELLLDRGGSFEDFDRFLESAKTRLADDHFNLSEAIKLQLRRLGLDDAKRTSLQRQLVVNQIQQADAGEGIVRVHYLEAAARLARDFGQSDLREHVTAELQKIGIDDLGLTEHRVEVQIPREEVERYMASFTEQTSWEDALLLMLAHGPPSGFTSANRQQAEELARAAPILAVVPHVEVGGDGLPRFTASTEEEKRMQRLVRYEMQRAQFGAVFLPEAFDRIWQKWGPLSAEELAAFLGSGEHVAVELAAALARDFLRFFNGDHEGASYATAAHVEALVRSIVLAIPLPIYRVQRQREPGRYPGLGLLLRELQANGLDESWARFLQGFLSEPMGLNFRNELLHGFEADPSVTNSALLLVCVLFLTKGVTLAKSRKTDDGTSVE